MTPEAMSFLWFLVMNEKVPTPPWQGMERISAQMRDRGVKDSPLFLAGAYLNVPIMMLMGRPYGKYLHYEENPNHLTLDEYYPPTLFNWAVMYRDPWLLGHIRDKLPEYVKELENHLPDALMSGRPDLAPYLINIGVDVKTAYSDPQHHVFSNFPIHLDEETLKLRINQQSYQSAYIAVWLNQPDVLQLLLPLLPDELPGQLLSYAVSSKNREVFQLLLQNTRVTHEQKQNTLNQLITAKYGEIDFVHDFMPLTAYRYDKNALLTKTATQDDLEMLLYHLNDPDVTQETWNKVNSTTSNRQQWDIFLLTYPKTSCDQKLELLQDWALGGDNMETMVLQDPCFYAVSLYSVLVTAINEDNEPFIRYLLASNRLTRNDIDRVLASTEEISDNVRALLT